MHRVWVMVNANHAHAADEGDWFQVEARKGSFRWGEVSWGGVTQGSAPLHPGLSPCAALRLGRARDAFPVGDATRARAPKGQPVRARGGTPGTKPHKVLCALKGHTGQGVCGHRSPRWGEMSWGGVTQGFAPLHRWAVSVRRVAVRTGEGGRILTLPPFAKDSGRRRPHRLGNGF
jgi:hypothetical protein